MKNAPTNDRLVLLGTGTCQLQSGRKASSVLVEVGGLRLVFDLGRGIADRLVEARLAQDDVEHVVLSHFHPDHVSDLVPYLHAAAWSQIDPRSTDLHVWGPHGLENQCRRLLSLFEPDTLRRDAWTVHLHEADADEIEIEGRRFGRPSLPPAGNRGLAFDAGSGEETRHVLLTGDAFHRDELVEAARRADLVVFDSGHLEDDEIVDLLLRADSGSRGARFVASHLYRELDVEALLEEARDGGFSGSLEAGEDLREIPLGGSSRGGHSLG